MPSQRLTAGFDIGRDGRLHWAQYEPMSRQTELFALDLGDASAKPQRVISTKLHGSPDDLVAGRDGYWLAVDDMTRGVCGGTVVWLGRDGARPIPVSAPACRSGPKRAAGEAEAIWATSRTFSHRLQVFVAKGPPPNGVAPLPHTIDGSLDVVVHANDGLYLALEHGEVIRLRPDGGQDRVAPPRFRSPSIDPRALAVHGDHVYLASGESLRKLELFRIPRAGGDWVPLGSFDVQSTVTRLYASDSGAVLHLLGDKGADRLLLIDPTGACPNVELPAPNGLRRVLVDRDVAYIQRDEGIVAASFAVRARTPSAAGSATTGGGS